MAERVSLWKRVSGMFRRGSDTPDELNITNDTLDPGPRDDGQRDAPTDAESESDDNATATAVAEPEAESESEPEAEPAPQPERSNELAPSKPAASSWRRSSGQAQLREVSQRVVDLADAMQQHFERQDHHASKFAQSLERVGTVLEDLARGQQAQHQCLQTIATQTENANKQAANLADTTGRIPDSLLAQAEAIRGVAKQLEASQESDTQLLLSLKSFCQAVDTLGSAGTAQVETLQRMNTAQNEQHEAFTSLVREQSKRFLIVIIVAAVIAVGALAAVGVLIFLRPGG